MSAVELELISGTFRLLLRLKYIPSPFPYRNLRAMPKPAINAKAMPNSV